MQPSSPRKYATVSSETSSPSPEPRIRSPPQPPMQPPPSRASTANVSEPSYQPQPLKEAVSMAFDTSEASHKISPDLVAQITQQVMNNLRMSGIGAQSSVPQKPAPAAPPSMTDSTPSIPPRDVYTPPSPDRDELSHVASHQSSIPENQADGSGPRMAVPPRPFERTSISREDVSSSASQRTRSPPTTGDQTTLEKIWQPMFGEDGKPTPRLGQFLRGIALHIIEDFEPRNSLVITPQKMYRFYENVRLTEEIYPWADMFGGKMSNSNISHLYRDLECQHHFVQRGYDEKPNIPALTPSGFQCWMTHVLQAHPDEEFLRLAKVTMDMPISNADDRKERFPKQLSRRLFPRQPNNEIRDLFTDSILADETMELPRRGGGSTSGPAQSQQPPQPPPSQPPPPSAAAPPPPQPEAAPMPPPPQPSYLNASFDKERKPYSANSSDVAVEDVPLTTSQSVPPPVSIERDRKPYFAQPGCGKVYDSDDGTTSRSSARPRRSNTLSGRRPAQLDGEGKERSQTRRPRAGSQSGPHPGFIPPRRTRSPSMSAQSNPYTRSEEGMPPSAYTSSTNRASRIYDDSDTELDRTYSREQRDARAEKARRRKTVDMHASYPTQAKPMFDPSGYQRQSADPTNGYGQANGGYQYPPPSYG